MDRQYFIYGQFPCIYSDCFSYKNKDALRHKYNYTYIYGNSHKFTQLFADEHSDMELHADKYRFYKSDRHKHGDNNHDTDTDALHTVRHF